ncbi:SpoIIE family protein phosphatase [Streptomyces sp. 796.1]|uniref:SpoIIE family protein phosphatase n=1 Tax=Streptomyces sp. 796.1 TaxID=3163029 RepID=UPI0039C99CB7
MGVDAQASVRGSAGEYGKRAATSPEAGDAPPDRARPGPGRDGAAAEGPGPRSFAGPTAGTGAGAQTSPGGGSFAEPVSGTGTGVRGGPDGAVGTVPTADGAPFRPAVHPADVPDMPDAADAAASEVRTLGPAAADHAVRAGHEGQASQMDRLGPARQAGQADRAGLADPGGSGGPGGSARQARSAGAAGQTEHAAGPQPVGAAYGAADGPTGAASAERAAETASAQAAAIDAAARAAAPDATATRAAALDVAAMHPATGDGAREHGAPRDLTPTEPRTPAGPAGFPLGAPLADGATGDRIRRADLAGNVRAPAAARQFVRAALTDWSVQGLPESELINGQLADDAVLLVSELVTNAVVHAGTGVVVRCALEPAGASDARPALYAEVTDHHPARAVRGQPAFREPAPGAGGGPRGAHAPGRPDRSHGSAGEPPGTPPAAGPGLLAPEPEPEPPAPVIAPAPEAAAPSGDARAAEAAAAQAAAGHAVGHAHAAHQARGEGAATDGAAEGEAGGRGGSGLRLVGTIAESWGTTYRRTSKSVWFRLPVAQVVAGADGALHPQRVADAMGAAEDGWPPLADLRTAEILAPAPHRPTRPGSAPGWLTHGAPTFLAEASELLAGEFDEGKVASLAGQLLVPRLADWCAVWLDNPKTGPSAPWVWHASENRLAELRHLLGREAPRLPAATRDRAVAWPWPGGSSAYGTSGAALACGLVTGGHSVGTLLIGRGGLTRIPDEVATLCEDFARRVALAVASAREYTRQVHISQMLQRSLLPSALASIPGMETAVVYEPTGDTPAGGDFYDVFPAGDGRWCFALGDVCGNGLEAAVVTGLVRPVLRLLAREGYGVTEVLDRLNRTLGEKAVEAAASAVAAEGPGESRFLSLLYGELVPYDTDDSEATDETDGADGVGGGDGAGSPGAPAGARVVLRSSRSVGGAGGAGQGVVGPGGLGSDGPGADAAGAGAARAAGGGAATAAGGAGAGPWWELPAAREAQPPRPIGPAPATAAQAGTAGQPGRPGDCARRPQDTAAPTTADRDVPEAQEAPEAGGVRDAGGGAPGAGHAAPVTPGPPAAGALPDAGGQAGAAAGPGGGVRSVTGLAVWGGAPAPDDLVGLGGVLGPHGAAGTGRVRRDGSLGGARCTLASAGHPLPLLLRADGSVAARGAPQLLLGVMDGVCYQSESFDLLPGETLLCVTDGVTEHRSDRAQFDDDDGLSQVLASCAGLDAHDVAQRVRAAVHAFAASPPNDDLALLVLQAAE